MLKWSEYRESGVLFEAYLPEHEAEPQEWLLRASRDGWILVEQQLRLDWTPRFGPEVGDIAALESALDELLRKLAAGALDKSPSELLAAPMYEPPAPQLRASNPLSDALRSHALQYYCEITKALALEPDVCSQFIGLAADRPVEGLLPCAVTEAMAERMGLVVAVGIALLRYPEPQRAVWLGQLRSAMEGGTIDDVRRLRDHAMSR
jgi:hypothetical protein